MQENIAVNASFSQKLHIISAKCLLKRILELNPSTHRAITGMPTRLKQSRYFLLLLSISICQASIASDQSENHQTIQKTATQPIKVDPHQPAILSPAERVFSTTCLQLSDKGIRSFSCAVRHLSASVADIPTYRFNGQIYRVSHPSTMFKLSISDATAPDHKLGSYDYNMYTRDAAFTRRPSPALEYSRYQCYDSQVIHFCAERK